MVTIKSEFEFNVQKLKFRIYGGLCRFYTIIGMYKQAGDLIQKRHEILRAMWSYIGDLQKGVDA